MLYEVITWLNTENIFGLNHLNMLPIDNEFRLLYASYFLLYSFIIYKIITETRSNKIRLTVFLIISFLLNIVLFSDSENFTGGGSLVVLFYSGFLFIITLLTIIINLFIINRKRKTMHNIGYKWWLGLSNHPNSLCLCFLKIRKYFLYIWFIQC